MIYGCSYAKHHGNSTSLKYRLPLRCENRTPAAREQLGGHGGTRLGTLHISVDGPGTPNPTPRTFGRRGSSGLLVFRRVVVWQLEAGKIPRIVPLGVAKAFTHCALSSPVSVFSARVPGSLGGPDVHTLSPSRALLGRPDPWAPVSSNKSASPSAGATGLLHWENSGHGSAMDPGPIGRAMGPGPIGRARMIHRGRQPSRPRQNSYMPSGHIRFRVVPPPPAFQFFTLVRAAPSRPARCATRGSPSSSPAETTPDMQKSRAPAPHRR